MKSKSRIKATQLVCLNCGYVTTIQRREDKLRNVGHIKDLYCNGCNEEQKHYEIKDVREFMWDYYDCDINQLDDNTKKVLNFLQKREANYEKETDRIYKKVLTRK